MPENPLSTTDAAKQLASALAARGQDYALGGAIALGYWSEPRGTMDVDLTIFLPPDNPSQCVWCLQEIGCEVDTPQALASLREHGFCRTNYKGVRVDVFLPTTPFYETARRKRHMVLLGD